MRLPILFFVFISLWHISVAQVSFTTNTLQNSNNCPLMEVSVNSNNHSGIIEVSYCNHGNAPAIGAYVEIEISNDLSISQSTVPVSFVVDEKYTFDLGDVNSSDCGAFYIEVPNIEKKIHCTNVKIFPNDPCQGMIDQYMVNQRENDDVNDDGDDRGTNSTAAIFSAEMYYSAPETPLLGQGGISSVFEDHVFLNNIPTWDSLLFVLTNSGVLPNVVNTNTTNTTNTMNGLDDITTLVSAELCFNSNGNTTVLTDVLGQTTTIATDDKTIFGDADGNDQVLSNDITVEAVNQKYENKELVVHLYPNPFSTKATITINQADYQETRLEILDLTGKIIQSLEFNEQKTMTLHRGNLIQGVYFYRLIGDNVAVHTGKFVIR